jgi:uncharacterized protein YuzE
MKLNYYQDTDSLYIDLSPAVSSNSKEIADGFVVDFDQAGRIVGIDIQQTSEHLDSTNPATTIL